MWYVGIVFSRNHIETQTPYSKISFRLWNSSCHLRDFKEQIQATSRYFYPVRKWQVLWATLSDHTLIRILIGGLLHEFSMKMCFENAKSMTFEDSKTKDQSFDQVELFSTFNDHTAVQTEAKQFNTKWETIVKQNFVSLSSFVLPDPPERLVDRNQEIAEVFFPTFCLQLCCIHRLTTDCQLYKNKSSSSVQLAWPGRYREVDYSYSRGEIHQSDGTLLSKHSVYITWRLRAEYSHRTRRHQCGGHVRFQCRAIESASQRH